jgi:hypothetical protein
MSEQTGKRPAPENVHSTADPKLCQEMAKRYGWKLERIVLTKDPILPVDCVFAGEQTSFEDIRYDT